MSADNLVFWMTVVGTLCWGICFWWMHRISTRQDDLLDQLRQQAQRIERLSKIEHDLIKEVHPQVNEIKEDVKDMKEAASEDRQDRKDERQEDQEERKKNS